ncbi:metal ABC transporter substrate-binding protein [Vineibacter terrae]|uniref:Metal ABC transporter substrate-binding protein n=1 Tax=Vineibacter terrae TaxID=2586908 RepID=A0A5C8PL67_9HYPH|nr:ABC transporter substrate-binding protein [Vineibacter terrae]TXL74119.1 metal ABC transporter substrate-binding protein [Vineibacter terrae]
MTRLLTGLAAALLSAALAASAAAQTKVGIGYTAVTDFAAAFVAREEGFFKKRGLDAELTLIAINSNIPAALMSDSIQFGGPTPSVFLQAVDGGLDLVAVSGASVSARENARGGGVVARTGVEIKTPQDFVGKKVGAPGLGAFLHVLFRQWLIEKGVDPRKVTFVEVSFPTMNDVLKGGTVDAVVTADPFMSRMVAAGTGTVAFHYMADLPDGKPQILYAATRDWAQKNAATVAAFRAAIAEGSAFVAANPDKTREHMGKYIKLPPEVLKGVLISRPDAALTADQLNWWVDVMKGQGMFKTGPDAAKLLLP